jgi:hypothetical protein
MVDGGGLIFVSGSMTALIFRSAYPLLAVFSIEMDKDASSP